MPELGPYGSVRGAAGNSRPYRECRPIAGVATSPRAGVGKPPGKAPAGRLSEGAPQALWGFRRCLRGRNAVAIPLRDEFLLMPGGIRSAGERRRLQ